jgi:hypothetical protein
MTGFPILKLKTEGLMGSQSFELSSVDRIRLPVVFDAHALAEEVDAFGLGSFVYYDVLPLRAPAHLVDPSRPEPKQASGFADGTWTEWLDTPLLQRSKEIRHLVDFFRQHTRVTLVRLLRLEVGATVQEHCDPTLALHIEDSLIRLTVPILTSTDIHFLLNHKLVPMLAGECWYLRLTDPHKIIHAGKQERINLTIDVAPNDWMLALLKHGEPGA